MLKAAGETSKGILQNAEEDRILAWDKEVAKDGAIRIGWISLIFTRQS